MRILLVGKSLVDVGEILRKQKLFVVELIGDGEDVLSYARHGYDIILLDPALPDACGYEVLKQLRVNKISTPVIFTSPLDCVGDRIKGLELGADDYLVRPFDTSELVARMRAVVRRVHGHTHNIIQVRQLVVDFTSNTATVGGEHVRLGGREWHVLCTLALRIGQVVPRGTIIDNVYKDEKAPNDRTIDAFISRLCKKFAAVDGTKYIESAHGIGYILVKDYHRDYVPRTYRPRNPEPKPRQRRDITLPSTFALPRPEARRSV